MKLNKKGFMMAEVIVVAVVIMVALVGLFNTFTRIFIQYDKRISFESSDAIYSARGLAEKYSKSIIESNVLNTDHYSSFDTNDFVTKNNIVSSYIVKYTKNSVEYFINKLSSQSGINVKFIEYLDNYFSNNDFNDICLGVSGEKCYNYIIFTEISNSSDNSKKNFGYYKFYYEIKHNTTVIEDKEPPIIENVKITPNNERAYGSTIGDFTVSWQTPSYDVNKFYIEIFDSSGKSVYKREENGFETLINLNVNAQNLKFGASYYATVYGEDYKGNKGNCGSTPKNCGKSVSTPLNFYVIYKDGTGTDTVKNASVTVQYNGSTIGDGGKIPYGAKPSIKISFTETKSLSYKVKSSSGGSLRNGSAATTITDLSITSDFTVEASSVKDTCLAEGTKVLLANGSYKNIEDIDYNDLLTIFDHENGTISYQYPSWIETPGVDSKYILITFDDNTELKVVKDHGIYSLDYNEYVRVNDRDKFKIGSRVVKINNGKLEEVKIKNIEVIEEEVKFYFMFTNRHFNLITNDILTGSPDVFIYNFHGFNEDLTWKTPLLENDVYSYDELSEVPYYLYKGMRVYEGKYFNNYGMNKEDYLNFLRNTIINEDRTVKPKLNKNGKREWMVTTSEDIVTEDNKLSYLMEEGDYYTLKNAKNIIGKKFIGWLHTGEKTMHQPGEKIEVLYGTHFIAQYNDLFDNGINQLGK